MNRNDRPIDPEPVLKRIVAVEQLRQMTIPRHQHCDYEFIYLRSGSYEYQHNALRHQLLPGQGFLLRPGDWHIDYLTAGTVYIAVNFILKNDDCNLLKDNIGEQRLVIADRNGRIARILDRLQEENDAADVFSSHLKEICVQELYWQIMRLLPREAVAEKIFRNEEDGKFVKDLRRIAMSHIRQTVSLADLAAQLCLSPRTLNNRCHELFGMSPLKTFTKIKMELALELLTQTAMSVKEISDYSGFQNPYHFSKVFKRIFAVSPTSCRNKSRRQP